LTHHLPVAAGVDVVVSVVVAFVELVVVVTCNCVVVVVVVCVVAVIELPQDAKTMDAAIKNVSSIQIVAFFIQISYFIWVNHYNCHLKYPISPEKTPVLILSVLYLTVFPLLPLGILPRFVVLYSLSKIANHIGL
jgi:hypothetical protein